MACHSPFPTLTPLGEAIAGNGFRLAPDEEPRDTINTGDPLLDLPRELALAVRLDAYAQAYANGRSAVDFESPPLFDPRDDRVKTDGGFAELIVRRSGSRWYGVALYNYVEVDRPLLNVRLGGPANVSRYQTITGAAGYSLRTNSRILGESTWDVELEEARWTLRLVTAF